MVDMSIEPNVNSVNVVLSVGAAEYRDIGRLSVFLNNRYLFEIDKRRPRFSNVQTSDGIVEVSKSIAAKPGDILTLAAVRGKSGLSAEREVLKTLAIRHDDLEISDEKRSGVKSVSAVGNRIILELDDAAFRGRNRYIVRLNGSYAFESFEGKRYYADGSTADGVAQLSRTIPSLRAGDRITVEVASGQAGAKILGAAIVASHTVP